MAFTSSDAALWTFNESDRRTVTMVTRRNAPVAAEVDAGMGIFRLNHAVLYVRDLEATVRFYRDVLGFERIDEMTPEGFAGAAFLRAPGSTNDHDLGLFEIGPTAGPSGAGRTTVGLYHLAWEVDTLDELERAAHNLSEAGALVGASDHGTTKSLYGKDPNGLEFEIVWLIPADLLDDGARDARRRISPLDLAKEKERYGAQTRGGIGVSVPVAG
jgi:catechol 2,3-dioxygenase-like lactoylglutathione lyase family enzyme